MLEIGDTICAIHFRGPSIRQVSFNTLFSGSPTFRVTDLLSRYMDTLNGISDSILRHLILTYGSSHYASTAYQYEPTCNANSYRYFRLGKYPISRRFEVWK